MIKTSENTQNIQIQTTESAHDEKWRSTMQPLLPKYISDDSGISDVDYNIMPFHKLGDGKIFNGYGSLAKWIIEQKTVLIDGYIGVFFDDIQAKIEQELNLSGFSVKWHYTKDYLKAEGEIEKLVKPFLSEEEDVWGTKSNLILADFYNTPELLAIKKDEDKDINIVIGIGAALLTWNASVIYFDIPKNEIQYRMRAGSITNLGKVSAETSFSMYKRFYFVDWTVLNDYKSKLLDRILVVADGQWLDDVNWLFKADLAEGLRLMSHSVLRARPWFEKGVWGGQWMKEKINALNHDEVNYAWSFELITPENGLVFESNGNLMEVSFDFLMLFEYKAVLGKHAETFGAYFPIRFDFLDTFKGGNLSIQCHPSRSYIQEKFGEYITQDETYYILDCETDAKVYLGFQENIDPLAFRAVLEESQEMKKEIDIEKYVQSFPSRKHELFLIPNGTVHSSGINNMVLEISATPYIFTFKMYDWLSLDLNGNPRPINIEHAFNNLKFERKGKLVETELIAKPAVIAQGTDWKLVHLPTHKAHFYDVHRIDFETDVVMATEDGCHVLMLVEGSAIAIEIDGKVMNTFHYAETFIVPAATCSYKLINLGAQEAKVIKSFIKNVVEL